MKTTLDQDTILYQLLVASPLKTAISGDVYKWIRPAGSQLEDVVINTITIGDGSVQRGAGNVNIYVPDVSVALGSKAQKMPNTARLKHLATLAVDTLKEYYAVDYNFWLAGQTTVQEVETAQHYINLRIEFKFHNAN